MKIAKHCVACDGTRLAKRPAILVPFIALRVFGWEAAVVDSSWGLRDVPDGNALSVCNSVMCHDCGMVFLDIRFDDDEMAALYSDYRGVTYTAMRARFEPNYPTRNALLHQGYSYIADIERFIEPYLTGEPRILDWGGDTGRNTPFRDRAALHHIYDISGQPVIEGAATVDLNVVQATTYDLIVFSNVLEHVPSPRTALREIAAVMHDRTVLYVEVPHEDIIRLWDRPQDRLTQKRHWHEHINFFSVESLDRVFEQGGLRIVERQSSLVWSGDRDAYVFSVLARLA